MKKFDLLRDVMGVPTFDRIDEKAFEKLISKCGKNFSRLIYEQKNQELLSSVVRKLPSHIATYCFNITSLDLTVSIFYPREMRY